MRHCGESNDTNRWRRVLTCFFFPHYKNLAEARHKEALEKEKIRRDYDRLRVQLNEIAQEEQKARELAGKVRRKTQA